MLSTARQPGEVPPKVAYSAPAECSALRGPRILRMPIGLRVDTNAVFIYATTILYLTTVSQHGGDVTTVFPCASMAGADAITTASGSDAKRGAGHAILFEQVLHTIHACASAKQHAETLLAAADTGEELSVFPKAGKMLIFFSRGDDGAVDPCSFHGGGAAVGVEVADGKWVMQLCKEVPFGARGRAAQATFVTARRRHALEYCMNSVSGGDVVEHANASL